MPVLVLILDSRKRILYLSIIRKMAPPEQIKSSARIRQVERHLRKLRALKSRHAHENWDGYGALPLYPANLVSGEAFIRALPDRLPLPEVSVDPDGGLSFDWVPGKSKTFTVSVNEGDRISYAWIDGSDRGHAAVKADAGGRLPDRLVAEIERIAGHASSFRTA